MSTSQLRGSAAVAHSGTQWRSCFLSQRFESRRSSCGKATNAKCRSALCNSSLCLEWRIRLHQPGSIGCGVLKLIKLYSRMLNSAPEMTRGFSLLQISEPFQPPTGQLMSTLGPFLSQHIVQFPFGKLKPGPYQVTNRSLLCCRCQSTRVRFAM